MHDLILLLTTVLIGFAVFPPSDEVIGFSDRSDESKSEAIGQKLDAKLGLPSGRRSGGSR